MIQLGLALPYGASPLARTWPGTVSLARATLRRVIVDVVGSLARHGFRRINSLNGRRVSVNDAYLEPARGRNNLAIFGESRVDKLLFQGDRAVGVRLSGPDGARQLTGGATLICAGAVHSPAILLRSGVGPQAHLATMGMKTRVNLPVGENFQDHPALFLPIKLQSFATPQEGFRHTNLCVRYSSGLAGACRKRTS